jgi:BASS family bile acid:Na+ symporter
MQDTLLRVLKIFAGVAIPLASLVTGLRAAREDHLWLVKRPSLLLRSLLTILVIVPVGAVLFLEAVRAPMLVEVGITIAIIAIGLGPPAALKQAKTHQESIAFELGLNVVLLLVAIVYIPLFVAIHGAIFHHGVTLGVGQVAKVVLTRSLIPLLVGIGVGRLAPRASAPLVKYSSVFIQVVLLVVVVVALVAAWRSLLALGGKAWLTCAAVALGEVVIGHAMGGPARETRRVLAMFSVMRFPALALLLTSVAARGREVVPVILAYVLSSVVMLALYGAITSLAAKRGRPAIPPPAKVARVH